MSAVEQLCPECGLCCNGVLFGDVELQRRDDPAQLSAVGLSLFSKRKELAFAQPCSCFDGSLCRIYTDRPVRCRTFECTQIQRVDAGSQSLTAARRKVRAARKLADTVADMCRRLGNTDEHEPLNQRYAAVMAAPMDLAGPEENTELRGELMLTVAQLVDLLENDFLAKPAAT